MVAATRDFLGKQTGNISILAYGKSSVILRKEKEKGAEETYTFRGLRTKTSSWKPHFTEIQPKKTNWPTNLKHQSIFQERNNNDCRTTFFFFATLFFFHYRNTINRPAKSIWIFKKVNYKQWNLIWEYDEVKPPQPPPPKISLSRSRFHYKRRSTSTSPASDSLSPNPPLTQLSNRRLHATATRSRAGKQNPISSAQQIHPKLGCVVKERRIPASGYQISAPKTAKGGSRKQIERQISVQ